MTTKGYLIVAPAANVVAGSTTDVLIASLRLGQVLGQVGAALAFGQDPTAAATNAVIVPAVTVSILDDLGAVCVYDNSTSVTVALTVPGGATLGGTKVVAVDAGVATFDDLTVDTASTYSLTASSGGLTPDVSANFVIS